MVRGFVINRFQGDGLHVEGNDRSSSATTSAPTRPARTARGNGACGVHLVGRTTTASAAPGTGERNVISGNATTACSDRRLRAATSIVGQLHRHRRRRHRRARQRRRRRRHHGGATDNTIGGTAAGARNVISGNAPRRHLLDGAGTTGNVVLGNYIGTDAAGTVAARQRPVRRLDQRGVRATRSAGPRRGAQRHLRQPASTGSPASGRADNLIQGNYIGTDAAGTVALGNGEDGVYLQDGSNNTVGGTTAAARNVISGNGWSGLTFDGTGTGNVVQGNYIGTNAAGTAARQPRAGRAHRDARPTTIGGTVAGAGNLIAYNGWDGVEISAGTGHSVLGNSIYPNRDLGIDLDAVLGGDGRRRTIRATATPGRTTCRTSRCSPAPRPTARRSRSPARSTAVSGTGYRVEFFANGASGQRYLGFATVPIGAAGTATFSATLTAPVALGETITATATVPAAALPSFGRRRRRPPASRSPARSSTTSTATRTSPTTARARYSPTASAVGSISTTATG